MAKQPSLQDCFAEIEAVIDELEDGDQPLEDAFKRYELGLKRLQQARQQLDQFQRRFEELSGADGAAAAECDGADAD